MCFDRSQPCLRGDIHSSLAAVDDVIAILDLRSFDAGELPTEGVPRVHYRSRNSVGNSLPRSRLRTRKNRTKRWDGVWDLYHFANDVDERSGVHLPSFLETLRGQIPRTPGSRPGGMMKLIMVDCIVCRYWSERLEDARRHRRNKRAPNI